MDGYTAVIFQHEVDHLDGILFTDRLTAPAGSFVGTFRSELPQRQRIAGNSAVVEEEQDGNAVQKACSRGAARKVMPQRQRNAGNGAVVEEG